METKRTITIKMLGSAFSEILNKLKFDNISHIELTEDLYRIIPTDAWQKFEEDITVIGSLNDDFDSLEKALSNKEIFLTYVDFDRTASLLRYISEKINPVTI